MITQREPVIVFIFSDGKNIKSLGTNDARKEEQKLLEDGWKHTDTIDICTFIEYHQEDFKQLLKK